MHYLIAFVVGCIFSGGLILSGMTDTQKIKGFLDLFGAWDPTLLFVMGGALIPSFIGWKIAGKMGQSVCSREFPAKPGTLIDRPLITGAVLFGVGWGVAGFCPGPALSSLAFGGGSSLIFVATMLAAMAGFEIVKVYLRKFE